MLAFLRQDGAPMVRIAQQEYIWKHIAEQYESLY